MHQYPKVYAFDEKTGYKGIPNIEGYIRRPGIENRFKLNAFGFNDRNFPVEHPDSIFRIIVVGSSLVEGTWSHQRETFVSLLHKKFQAAGYHAEVMNCAMSGSERGLQNLAYYKESTQRFRPNLVLYEFSMPLISSNYTRGSYLDYSILYAGENLKELSHSQFVAQKRVDLVKRHKFITDLYDLCYCMRVICRQYFEGNHWGTVANCCKVYAENKSDSWQYFSMDVLGLRKSITLVNDFADTVKRMDARVLAFEYGSGYAENLHDSSLTTKFPLLSLGLDLGDEYRLSLDGHFNLLGDSVVADALFSRLKEYIPGEFHPNSGKRPNNN